MTETFNKRRVKSYLSPPQGGVTPPHATRSGWEENLGHFDLRIRWPVLVIKKLRDDDALLRPTFGVKMIGNNVWDTLWWPSTSNIDTHHRQTRVNKREVDLLMKKQQVPCFSVGHTWVPNISQGGSILLANGVFGAMERNNYFWVFEESAISTSEDL